MTVIEEMKALSKAGGARLHNPVSFPRNFIQFLPTPAPHIASAITGEATEGKKKRHGQFLSSSLLHCLLLIQVTILAFFQVTCKKELEI